MVRLVHHIIEREFDEVVLNTDKCLEKFTFEDLASVHFLRGVKFKSKPLDGEIMDQENLTL